MRRLLAFRARQLHDDLAFHARHAHVPRRTIAITGSSGLIGTQLAALLETGGHTVRRMVREPEVAPGEISWNPKTGELDPADLEGVDVVVNLAGRSIATRWTATARREIRDSRLNGTVLLSRTLAGMREGPAALVQASAIGLYGPRRPGELLTEADPGGEGFLADLVRDWEGASRAAAEAGVRVAQVRTGMALSDAGGSLLPQLPLFLAGVGGRLTDGEAMTSWISLDDVVRAFAHAALDAEVTGPLNGVGPQPVTAREFARTLGGILHRPALLPVPRPDRDWCSAPPRPTADRPTRTSPAGSGGHPIPTDSRPRPPHVLRRCDLAEPAGGRRSGWVGLPSSAPRVVDDPGDVAR